MTETAQFYSFTDSQYARSREDGVWNQKIGKLGIVLFLKEHDLSHAGCAAESTRSLLIRQEN
jgi:hypothetical protein